MNTIRKYKGYVIHDWSGPYGQYPDSGEPKCYVQTQHTPTGIDWCAQECPKFWSYKSAREWINNQKAEGRA